MRLSKESNYQRAVRISTVSFLSAIVFAIVMVVSMFNSSSCYAQEFEVVKSRGFDVENGEKLNETITVDGKTFDLFATSKGSKYMKLKSPRTGNWYAVWVGSKTGKQFEGRDVYKSKRGKYCVFIISKNTGNPYPKWLKVK